MKISYQKKNINLYENKLSEDLPTVSFSLKVPGVIPRFYIILDGREPPDAPLENFLASKDVTHRLFPLSLSPRLSVVRQNPTFYGANTWDKDERDLLAYLF